MRTYFRMTLTILILTAVAAALNANAADTRQRAERIMLQKVAFEEASIDQIVQWIRETSRRRDPEGAGINVLLRRGAEENAPSKTARVTLDITNVPVSELIRYVCLAAGMNYRLDETAVVLADPSVQIEKMETRFYPVSGDILKAAAQQAKGAE